MEQNIKRGTPDERIAFKAKAWRRVDQAAIANKTDREKQRDEYRARTDLRKTIDDAGCGT